MFGLLLQSFRLRTDIVSQGAVDLEDQEIEQIETALIEAVISMTLKLNDATFRPFFAQLVEQQAALVPDSQQSITFYNFLAAFFDKFKVCLRSRDLTNGKIG